MQPDNADAPRTDQQLVIDYLRQDPEFFVRHPSILAELTLPHDSGQAVSLVERQMIIMRERNVDMRQKMSRLLKSARVNDLLFSKTRSLNAGPYWTRVHCPRSTRCSPHICLSILKPILSAVTFSGVNHTLDHLVNHPGELPFNDLFNGTLPVCTTLRESELQLLFPAATHNTSASAIILPLSLEDTDGALCIGSRDATRFSNDMDTLFVTYIADVLSKVLSRLQNP